jgi:flavin-binding protein dodecin
MIQPWWFYVSGLAFVCGIAWLLISGWVGLQLLIQMLSLLSDTHRQVQDLGDLAANTVGRASDTMDLVEIRVSETMGQATQGGAAANQSVVGVGATIAAVYMASRFVGLLRGDKKTKRRNARRHRSWRR